MAADVDVVGEPNHHAGVELGVIAERAQRDADERIVERIDSGGRESDRDGLQCELQRIEPAAGGVLPERNAVRIGIGIAAYSDTDLDADGDQDRHPDGDCNSDSDAHDATDSDTHFNSGSDANRYGNRYSDEDSIADYDIDLAADGNADPWRIGELSHQLCGQQRLGDRLHRGAFGE